jgi:hypothetical protein
MKRTTTKEGEDNNIRVDNEESVLVKSKQQALGMVPEREDGEIVSTIKSGVDEEKCGVKSLKEMSWILVENISKGGQSIYKFYASIF